MKVVDQTMLKITIYYKPFYVGNQKLLQPIALCHHTWLIMRHCAAKQLTSLSKANDSWNVRCAFLHPRNNPLPKPETNFCGHN